MKAMRVLGLLMFMLGLLGGGLFSLVALLFSIVKISSIQTFFWIFATSVFLQLGGLILVVGGGSIEKYGVTEQDLFEDLVAELMAEGKSFEEAKKEAEEMLARLKEKPAQR